MNHVLYDPIYYFDVCEFHAKTFPFWKMIRKHELKHCLNYSVENRHLGRANRCENYEYNENELR